MYSSLPSASKLYVRNTNATKQKNGTVNQKRKRIRKKPLVSTKRTEGNSLDVVTLVGADSNCNVQNTKVSSEKSSTESERDRKVVSFNENVVVHGEAVVSEKERVLQIPSECEALPDDDDIVQRELAASGQLGINDGDNEIVLDENVLEIVSDMSDKNVSDTSDDQNMEEDDELKITVVNCDESPEFDIQEKFSCREDFVELDDIAGSCEIAKNCSISNEKLVVNDVCFDASDVHNLHDIKEFEKQVQQGNETDGSLEFKGNNDFSHVNGRDYGEAEVNDKFCCSSVSVMPSSVEETPNHFLNEVSGDSNEECGEGKADQLKLLKTAQVNCHSKSSNNTLSDEHHDSYISDELKSSPQPSKISNDSISESFSDAIASSSVQEKTSSYIANVKGSSISLKSLPDVHAKVNALSRTNSLPENCFKLEKSFLPCTLPDSELSTPFESSLVEEHFHHEVSTSPLSSKTHKQDSSYSLEYIGCGNAVDQPSSHETSIANISSLCSQASSSLIQPVTTKDARLRSYVVGNIRAQGSILGVEELVRYFPDRKVTVFVGTWNMNGQEPPSCLDDFLLPLDIIHLPDIYAIGVQEGFQSRSEWEILMQSTIGPSHVLFTSTSLGVLHLAIFLRRDLVWFCSEPEEASIATRPGSMVKTKGAVAVSFMFFGSSFLFINSHLTAHERKLKERLADYEKICSLLDLPKSLPLKPQYQGKDVTSRFDYVFWCGDLNFRVVQDRPTVLSFVQHKLEQMIPTWELLVQHDQLYQAMRNGEAFHGFEEGVIDFVPSFKFDVGTSSFDSSKQRVPSYTDRVLYRCKQKGSVQCTHYNIVSDIQTSDHKPVCAAFEVRIKPGRDNIPLAAGMFKRDIYLEAVRRRATALEVVTTNQSSSSAICHIM